MSIIDINTVNNTLKKKSQEKIPNIYEITCTKNRERND